MATIGNLAAAVQAQVDALDTVFPAENGAANATIKITIAQMLISMLRPGQLAAGVTADVTAAAKWLVEDPTFAGDAKNRYLTLPQMVALMNARTSQLHTFQPTPKVGATAGWVVGAANNLGKMATIPAAQANSTLVVPLPFYKIGSHLRNAFINGSVQSAGNAGAITVDLRMLTAAAAGAVDSSLSVLGAPLSVVANTIWSIANTITPTIDHVVAAGESFYLLLTCTTGAAVTAELQNVGLTVDEV